VAFIEDFSASLALECFHLVGHSMGGCIALLYALQIPDKIDRLPLANSIGLGHEIALWVRVLSAPVFCWTFGEVTVAIMEAIEQLLRFLHAPVDFVNPIPRIRAELGASITSLKGQSTVLLDRLSELVVPTMLVWGDKDPIVPASHAVAAARLIPDCRVHILPGTGHSVHREKMEEFCQLLARFQDQPPAAKDRALEVPADVF